MSVALEFVGLSGFAGVEVAVRDAQRW